jgi:two-component system sensor histidine kinase PfeS
VDSSCWVRGHLNTLAQALENILRNAIRHSPQGGVVRLGGQRDGDYWHVWLEDEGGGVAEADLERIFSPFIRLDGSRPGDGGFGLGLSIARNAVQRQGGSLWAENTETGLRLNMRLVADIDGVSDDAIASRLAPTVEVCRPQMVLSPLNPVGASLLAIASSLTPPF